MPCSPARGAPRSPAGIAHGRRTSGISDGVDVTISPDPPRPPAGWEVYVSTAFAGLVAGRPRADLLAELVSLRRSIVVAGAHGKTTTTAMIAFCLDRLGLDPAFLVGGEVPQLGGNARARGRMARGRGRRVGPLALCAPAARSRCCSTSTSTTTRRSRPRAEVEALFEEWLAQVPQVVRAESLAPVDLHLAVPGEHNRRNAAAALAALELGGRRRRRGARHRRVRRGRTAARASRRAACRRQLRAPSRRDRRRSRRAPERRPRARALPAAPVLADALPRARVRVARSPPPTPCA